MSGSSIKLHLGCGDIRLEGFINIDSRKTPATDMLMDISQLAFKSNSIETIYTSHVLEHFSFHIVPGIMAEWYRVLKYNGELILRVPDFDIMVTNYVKGKIYHLGRNILTDAYMGEFMGGQDYPENFHKTLFTEGYLREKLVLIGFKQIERKYKDYLPVIDASKHPSTMTLRCVK